MSLDHYGLEIHNYGLVDVSRMTGSYSAHDLRMLGEDVSRMVPNWRLVYDGDLLEAARDLGLLDEDDPAEGDYDELDLSEEASWRRYSDEPDEGEEDYGN